MPMARSWRVRGIKNLHIPPSWSTRSIRVGASELQGRQYAKHSPGELAPPSSAETFLQGNAATYLDIMYTDWKKDSGSVHLSWQAYFNALENGRIPPEYAFQPPLGLVTAQPVNLTAASPTYLTPEKSSALEDQIKVQLLVRAYQARGHSQAKIDPLDMPKENNTPAHELQLECYGFSESDLDREFLLGPGLLPNFASENRNCMTLREIIKACETVYCGSFGVEYLHIPSREECDWIRSRIERPDPWRFSVEEKKRILDRLIWATSFEHFLDIKFPNAKRFGLEGVESQIPALKAIVDASADQGVRNIVFACCHRGKLNVLSNVARKPNELIFSEFSSNSISRHQVSGDVKYHLGMNYERETPSGRKVNISVLPNPSHLESIDPLAQGMARAIQQQNGMNQQSTMVLNSHTDAAVSGQGIVYETLGLSDLKAYGTGGTVHLVVNNQVGFTTDPKSSRSSTYVSDIAKSVDSPIFHVNADDVEAVVFLSKLVADYRAKFKKDCWIDLVCYRKNGHNEMDQPSFTQPLMYERVAKKLSHLDAYTDKLLKEGVVTREEVDRMQAEVWGKLGESLDKSKDAEGVAREYLTAPWKDFKTPAEVANEVSLPQHTAIKPDVVKTIASKMGVPEEPFNIHKSLTRILQKRQHSLVKGSDIDWATGEALALGSLLLEGHHVRISGQDVERGTFSQRHAVLHDQHTGETYTPLDSLSANQARFTINNSSLSELGIMGFDYGYSCAHPNALVMWEAQFGDFANNAQVIIDQFISSAENKWLQRSGMVLSLPHGFDGQGPEHSSARIERFLQLCAEDYRVFPSEEKLSRQHQDANMQVVCMTTPANLFHVLRRQLHRDFRKPLIIFFSKSLLRHPLAKSNIEGFIGDSGFQHIIPDPAHGKYIFEPGIKRVIYCTGQIYMALSKHRETHNITDTAITRLEQLHPFPWRQVRDNINQYPNVEDVVWCQEESLHDGAFSFARSRFETIFDTTEQHKGRRLRFAGREPTPSVATGFHVDHHAQEEALVRDSFQHIQSESH